MPFFRSMWQHRLNQPVADGILLHYCPGGKSAPEEEPFYWCKKRDCKFIIKKATITRNYTRLHTTIFVPANNRGYSDCIYEPLITALTFTATGIFSCIFRVIYILLFIRTGWKDFDSQKGIWISPSFSITGWLMSYVLRPRVVVGRARYVTHRNMVIPYQWPDHPELYT